MDRKRYALAVGLGLALLLFIGCDPGLRAAPDAGAVDKAFARFWNAPDTTAAAKAVKDVVEDRKSTRLNSSH